MRFGCVSFDFRFGFLAFVYATINYTFNLVSLEMLQKYQCPDFGGGIFLYIHIMLYILRANSIYISI